MNKLKDEATLPFQKTHPLRQTPWEVKVKKNIG